MHLDLVDFLRPTEVHHVCFFSEFFPHALPFSNTPGAQTPPGDAHGLRRCPPPLLPPEARDPRPDDDDDDDDGTTTTTCFGSSLWTRPVMVVVVVVVVVVLVVAVRFALA